MQRSNLTMVNLIVSVFLAYAPLAMAHENHDRPVKVNQHTTEEFVETALENIVATKGDKLFQAETTQVISNIKSEIKTHSKSVENVNYFDSKWSHYIRCTADHNTRARRANHLRECPTCSEVTRDLLRRTRIRPLRLRIPFSDVYLDGFWYRVDATGYTYRVYPNGRIESSPRGQLVYVNGGWWATDGWRWFGPIKKLRRP